MQTAKNQLHSSGELRVVKTPAPKCVSVVIPVYNGACTIGPLVEELVDKNPGYDLEIVLVNDASKDGSENACLSLCRRHPQNVTFVNLAKNSGEHNAVMAGLNHARGQWCVIMDDDRQNPPQEAFRLAAEAIRGGYDIVFSRYAEKKHHPARNLFSKMANASARKLMRLPEGLYLSSFKCLSRFTVDHIKAYKGPFPYIDGLALRATDNISTLQTMHEPSRKGKSCYTVEKLFRLWAVITVNFSITPLRIASLLGIFFSLIGAVGAASTVVEKILNPSLPVGWPSLIVALFVLSGVQLLILGVVGEYLGQLLLTANGTPQYVVREVVRGAKEGEDEE